MFFKVVKAAFGQRRKTIANAMKGAGFTRDTIEAAFAKSEIDSKRRGETFTLKEFAALADAMI